MSTAPKLLPDLTTKTHSARVNPLLCVALFGSATQLFGTFIILLTVIPELSPIAVLRPVVFWLYYALKVLSFLSMGFLAPLALRSLNSIGLGMILAFLSAFLIETCQGLLHNGHVFHWYELAGKLTLIALGFAFGLDARYELKLSIGPLVIKLLNEEE